MEEPGNVTPVPEFNIHFDPLSTAEYGLKLAKEAGLATILDPAPYQKLGTEVFAHSDIITPNEKEAEQLTGIRIDTF